MMWLFLSILCILAGASSVFYYIHKFYPIKKKDLDAFIKTHCLKKMERQNCVTCRTCPFRPFIESNDKAKIMFFNMDQAEKKRVREEKRLAREAKKLEKEEQNGKK